MKVKKMLFFFVFLFLFIIYKPVFAETGVDIKNVEVIGQRGEVIVGDLDYHDNVIESSLTFNELNDFIIFRVTLENHDDVSYQLQDIDGSFYEYLTVYSDDIDTFIEAGATKDVSVKVMYDKLVINEDTVSVQNSTLTFLYTEKIVNPETGFHSVSIIFLLLAIGLFPAMFFKVRKRFIVLLFIFIPLIAFAYQEVNVQMTLREVTIKGKMMEYTIIIDDGDGNTQHVTIVYGDTLDHLPQPDKTGYTFDHWEDEDGNELDPDTIVEGNMRIVAQYDPITYHLDYILNQGDVSGNPDTYTIEDNIVIVDPTRPGYTFTGWSEGDSGTVVQQYVITPGDYGDKTLVAHWDPRNDVSYTVIHKQMKVDGSGYDVYETENLVGTADASVTPATKTYTGFTSPSTQTVTINPEGTTEVVYNYDRIQYTFSITDRTYVNNNTTANGTYYYGTSITLSAKTRNGYAFQWSDGNENYNRTITLTGNLSLSLVYRTSDNTAYTVNYYFMSTDGTSYDSQPTTSTLYGTTGESVTPLLIDYDGFITPASQTNTISGDGSTVFNFYYVRRKYQVTFTNYLNLSCTLNGESCYTASGDYVDEGAGLYEEDSITLEFYYGTTLNLQANRPTGYSRSWSRTASYIVVDRYNTYKATYTVPYENTSFGPVYTPLNVSYLIEYVGAETEDGPFTYIDYDYGYALAGTTVTLNPPSLLGYTALSTSQTEFISGSGNSSFTFQYLVYELTITFTNPSFTECSIEGISSPCYSTQSMYDDPKTVQVPGGSTISLSVVDPGYDVYWESNLCSDSESDTCTFTLNDDNLTIGPTLSPKDVTYTVCDELMRFSESDFYHDEDSLCFTDIGKHGTAVTPEVSSYTGFISPEAETITLNYNHSDENMVTYQYTRRQYTFEIEENANEVLMCLDDPDHGDYSCEESWHFDYFSSSYSDSLEIYYGHLVLKAPEVEGYLFEGWSDGEEDEEREFDYFSSDTSLYPIYTRYYTLTIDYDYEYVELSVGGDYYDAEEENIILETNNTVTLRVKENDGYYFDHWENDYGTSETITITVDNDIWTYPVFESYLYLGIGNNQYVLIQLPEDNSYHAADSSYYLKYDDTIYLRAIDREQDRYMFRTWRSDTELGAGRINPDYSFSISSSIDISPIYSYFYYMTVDSDAEYVEFATHSDYFAAQTAETLNVVFAEEDLYLRVTEKEGYTFTGWSNGETDEEIQINLNSDFTIHPIFVLNGSGLSYRKQTNDIYLLKDNHLHSKPITCDRLYYDDRMRYIL